MTRAKICGITRHEDAELAVGLGAWAIGLIRWAGSPRACEAETAAAIVGELRRRVACVGVFVNATLEELAPEAEAIGFTHLQLHGDEGPAFCAEAARRTGCKIIKAARVAAEGDIRDLERFRTDFHLLDAAAGGLRGGSGRDVGLGHARRPALEGPADPVRRPRPRQRRRGDRGGAALGGRQRLRDRERARRQGPREGPALPRDRRG